MSRQGDITTDEILTGLNATFLDLETPEKPVRVGSLKLSELRPASKAASTRR
ncbi:hypothetical protein [Polaromonas sp.]|uniref:hypothetical protein n=1 Tax=Polaromonas sp. TaxID=1869339 RepID=UPI002D7746E6|nr:hypothetical protein [Polaromonas sp.]